MDELLNPSEWAGQVISDLPITREDFYKKLWGDRRLRSDSFEVEPDCVDEANARLVCTALRARKQLLLILPNNDPRRGPYLLATGVILHFLSRGKRLGVHRRVLYFGSTIGIRDHLSSMKVGPLRLDVFPQARMGRDFKPRPIRRSGTGRGRRGLEDDSNTLPEVFCIYAPADAQQLFTLYEPDWVAIDCGNSANLPWLSDVLKVAGDRQLPLVAWTSNPLSHAVRAFDNADIVVLPWPVQLTKSPASSQETIGACIQARLVKSERIAVSPIVIIDRETDGTQARLRESYVRLASLTAASEGMQSSRLANDTIRLGWRYLRALENLVVPTELQNSEARNLWGISSLDGLGHAFSRYVDLAPTHFPEAAQDLAKIQFNLSEAKGHFEDVAPPYWLALCQLCIEEQSDTAVFVFPSKALRELFSFGLLAYHNITVDDLEELDIWLTYLNDLNGLLVARSGGELASPLAERLNLVERWSALFIGLPSTYASSRLDPVLRSSGVLRPLIFPYQAPSLSRRVTDWGARLFSDPSTFALKLAGFLDEEPPPAIDVGDFGRIEIDAEATLEVYRESELAEPGTSEPEVLWEPYDPLDEVSYLIRANLGMGETEAFEERAEEDALSTHLVDMAAEDSLAILDAALEVKFHGGWIILLDPDDKVRVVTLKADTSETTTEDRYARSLRPGDKLLFIHRKHHQNLYELIVARIHQKPGINLHMKLVQRWRDDLARAYAVKRSIAPGWSVADFLQELQDRGSSITTTLALRNWLNGETIAPDDPVDMRRVAEIFGMEFVREEYRRINGAAERIRAIHRGLGRRLNGWLRQQLVGETQNAPAADDVLDSELGLTFSDFRESLQVLEVAHAVFQEGPFLSDALGQLRKA